MGSYQPVKIAYSKFKLAINSHEYVNMGTGVKWVTVNVGAYNPEEFGHYFAWGETSPKDDYSWSTYFHGKGNTFNKYHKKWNEDVVLDLKDDTANKNWGGSWHMSTRTEWNSLVDTKQRNDPNYTWTWYDGVNKEYNNTDVKGWEVVWNMTGDTLFFPIAGYKGNTSYIMDVEGVYWTSSMGEKQDERTSLDQDDMARFGYFSEEGFRKCYYALRCVGKSVRPRTRKRGPTDTSSRKAGCRRRWEGWSDRNERNLPAADHCWPATSAPDLHFCLRRRSSTCSVGTKGHSCQR